MVMFRVLLCVVVCAVVVSASSSVEVTSPPRLKRDHEQLRGLLTHTPAVFGSPPYGSFISGVLWYPQNPINRLGCSTIEPHLEPNGGDFPSGSSGGGVIVMLDRSPHGATGAQKCSFVTKVRNAWLLGATAVVIKPTPDDTRSIVYMASDGSDRLNPVPTPAVMLTNTVGNLLADNMRLHNADNSTTFRRINIQIGWQIPTQDGTVDWQLWTFAYDKDSALLKSRFGRADLALHMYTSFEPVYVFIRANAMPQECNENPDDCDGLCIKQGEFCVDDPNGNINDWLTGQRALEESVWQMCVWKEIVRIASTSPDKHSTRNKWWTYVANTEKYCNTEQKFGEQCRRNRFDELGFPEASFTTISSCFTECGVDKSSVDKRCLMVETAADNRTENGIFYTPTLVINGEAVRGSLTCNTPLETQSCSVLADICTGYTNDTRPSLCTAPSTGCDFGVPRDCAGICGGNYTFDACRTCLAPDDPARNKLCTDCAGVLNGDSTYDKCGLCKGPKDPARDTTCKDCAGKLHGNATKDCAGVCLGLAELDKCGACIRPADKETLWNKSCSGSSSSSTSWGTVIAIVLAVSGVVGVSIYLYMKRQQNRMREDIDGILKQYLPLQDGVQGQGHIRPTQRLDGNETL